VGKTRLALVVAVEVSGRYAHGAWYVDLVPVTDATMVGPALASALGVGESARLSAEETIITWIADRELLLCSTTASTSSTES
jgi:predicted ATPase